MSTSTSSTRSATAKRRADVVDRGHGGVPRVRRDGAARGGRPRRDRRLPGVGRAEQRLRGRAPGGYRVGLGLPVGRRPGLQPLLPGGQPAVRRTAVTGLERYIEEIQDGATWHEAFPDAFGVEADEFYAEFDAWMEDDLLAPRRIPTAFREIYPVEQEAPVTILSSSDEILPGDQAIVLAETERGSACSFTLRDENGERVATMAHLRRSGRDRLLAGHHPGGVAGRQFRGDGRLRRPTRPRQTPNPRRRLR